MEQIDIFDLGVEYHYRPPLHFDRPVKLFEAFAGIGCQAMSFKRAKIPYEIIGISEIDKHSLVSHKAIHSKHNNYGDISLMGEIPPCDVFTWSFPCQSLSKAGKRAGFKDMRKSGLVFQVLRLLRDTYGYIPHRHQPKNSTFHSMGEATNYYTPGDKNKLPKVLIMENVPDLVQNSFKAQFYEIQKEIASYGYKNFTLTLNAKDYGVAQNRDRVFMVSLLGDYHYEFPMPIKLEKRLKDYLEPNVAEKYYLNERQIGLIQQSTFRTTQSRIQDDDVCDTLNTCGGGNREPKIAEPICLNSKVNGKQPSLQDRIYSVDGTSTAITQAFMPSIAIDVLDFQPEATERGYAFAQEGDGVYINRPHQKRGVVQKGKIQALKTSGNDVGVVVNGENNIITLEYIYGLCDIIDMKESVKYERSKPLLRVLWEEIGKKEIQQEIRRLYGFQEKEILRQDVHEKRVFEDWKQSQSNLHKRTYDSKNDQQLDIKENNLRYMWERFKRGYTPQRWELEEQQFRQLNEFMSQLPQQTTQGKTKVRNMRGNNERFRVLQQTLYSLQEIWRPTLSQEQSKMRIRKLCPIEVWRLMGISDEDYYKAAAVCSNSQLYKQAGNGIVVDVFAAILKNLIEVI